MQISYSSKYIFIGYIVERKEKTKRQLNLMNILLIEKKGKIE